MDWVRRGMGFGFGYGYGKIEIERLGRSREGERD